MGMPIATFFTWVTGGFGAIVGAMAIGGLFTMSRMVSRLSLVQQKAHGAAPKTARKFLRMSTSVQESMPLSRGPRELPVSAAQVDLLQGRKNRFGDRGTSIDRRTACALKLTGRNQSLCEVDYPRPQRVCLDEIL